LKKKFTAKSKKANWNNIGVKAFGRFYPFQGLFVELGARFGYRTGTEDYTYNGVTHGDVVYANSGFLLEPGVGWKFDLGRPGGFYIEPNLSVPIVMGSKKYDFTGAEGEFKAGVGFIAAFGMGYVCILLWVWGVHKGLILLL
jgi:hypothetical protein